MTGAPETFEVGQEHDPWVKLPLWLLDEASDNAIVVYGHLARYAHMRDGARPSIAEVARRSQRSRKTVQRAINELREMGAITVENRWSDDGLVRLPSRYFLRTTDPKAAAGGRDTSDP